MTARSVPALRARSLRLLQQTFVADILPRVEAHGRVYFRHVRCFHKKQELLAELRALSWKWYVRLVRRGKNVLTFVSALASYAARAVNSGRRVCGQEASKDALSPSAQKRHRFSVSALPLLSTLNGNPLDDALSDTTQSSPDELAAFRVDFSQWLDRLGERNRALAVDMALGYRTDELAQSYRISPARVSQLRRQFSDNWQRFHGEAPRSARC